MVDFDGFRWIMVRVMSFLSTNFGAFGPVGPVDLESGNEEADIALFLGVFFVSC